MQNTEDYDAYRRLFDEAPIAYHEVDVDGIVRRVNRAECELLGLDASQIMGHPAWEFVVPEQRAMKRAQFHRFRQGERKKGPFEFDWVRPNGTRCSFAVYLSLIEDAEGNVVGARSARLDITSRKQAERAHEEQRRLAQLNADVTRALASGDSMQVSLQCCAEAVSRHLGVAWARIWTLNEAKDVLDLQASGGKQATLTDSRSCRVGGCTIGAIATERKPYVTDSLEAGALCGLKWGEGQATVAFAGYPLVVHAEVFGVLAILSPGSLTQAVIEALELTAQEIALGIERRRTEEALRLSEARYRRIVETTAEGIRIDDVEGRATYVNNRMCELSGYTEGALVGHTPFEIVPLERHAFLQQRLESVRKGETEIFDSLLRRPGGSTWWANICATRILDEDGELAGTLTMFTDITQRKNTEDALRASEGFNKGIVENAGDGILVLEAKGKILYLSQSAQRLLEIDAPEHSFIEFWAGPDRKNIEAALENATSRGSGACEGTFTTRGGSTRHLDVSFSADRHSRESTPRLVAVVRDISERKQLQAQLMQAQKLESIGHLAAGVAHEINTPIQYVGDNARFLQDAFRELMPMLELDRLSSEHRSDVDYLCDEIPKSVAQLLEGVEHVARIVRAMKEFSHPGPPEKTAVDLNRAIQSTITVSRNEWKYIADLVEDLDWELPAVQCLPGEINQVILNLIVNAAHAIADATPPGSHAKGTVAISTRRIGDYVEIRVRDTGAGIPEAIRARIFDPFFTTKEVGKGTGQGLSIAHTVVVKNHGGTIHFETEENAGTTFIVRLPIAPED